MRSANQSIVFDDDTTIRVPLDLEDRQAQLLELLEQISGIVTATPLSRYGRTNRVTDAGQSIPIPVDPLARHAQVIKALENLRDSGVGGGLLSSAVGAVGEVTGAGKYFIDGFSLHFWNDDKVGGAGVSKITILS